MFGMVGRTSGELLSFNGRMLIHDNRAEVEWLFRDTIRAAVVLRGSTVEEVAHRYGRPVMLLRDHPDMSAVRFPLDPKDFR